MTGRDVYDAHFPVYTLALYPTDQLYEVYSTTNPRVAAAGAVCMIVLTSLLFWLYDFLVRREFLAKKEILDSKRKIMRFVSHEVRTPLNSICMGISVMQHEIAASLGYNSADKLRETGIGSPGYTTAEEGQTGGCATAEESQTGCKQLEWFKLTDEVMRHTQIAVDVLNDLLNYDKIESGTLSLERTQIPIWHLIERAVSEFNLPASKKKLDFQLNFSDLVEDGDEDLKSNPASSAKILSQNMLDLKVLGDAARLTQVLRNLLSNAIKFTPDEGTISVHATCDRPAKNGPLSRAIKSFRIEQNEVLAPEQSGCLKVTVRDTGAGMTKDQLSRLFREGLQFNAAVLQEGQGSGYGLYIAKGIVELHGGTLKRRRKGLVVAPHL